MNELNIYALLSELDEDIIESTVPPSLVGGFVPRAKKESLFSRFMSNGWVAAVLSAVVAIGVIVAIVLAGRGDGPVVPPVGTSGGNESESGESKIENETIPADSECPFEFSAWVSPQYPQRGETCTVSVRMTNKTSETVTYTAGSSGYREPFFHIHVTTPDGQETLFYDLAAERDVDADMAELVFEPGEEVTLEWAVPIPADAPVGRYSLTAYFCPHSSWKQSFPNFFPLGDYETSSRIVTVSNGEQSVELRGQYRVVVAYCEVGLMVYEPNCLPWDDYIRKDLPTVRMSAGESPTIAYPWLDHWTYSTTVHVYDTDKNLILEGSANELATLPDGTYSVVIGLEGRGPVIFQNMYGTDEYEHFDYAYAFRLEVGE